MRAAWFVTIRLICILINVLISCEFEEIKPGGNSRTPGWRVSTVEILKWFDILARKKPISRHLTPHLKSLGFIPNKNGLNGWLLPADKVAGQEMIGSLPSFSDALIYMVRKNDAAVSDDDAMSHIRRVRQASEPRLGEDF